jgi:NAD-dependent dihydropyrimidine dehydrogenase PreA subunit
MKAKRTTTSQENKYRLASFDLVKPGFLTLLFKRSFIIGMADYIFHIGIYGSIITGAIMEISNFIPMFASMFSGFGWLIAWSHGVTGILLIVGGAGFVMRYFKNQYFALAWGKIFYMDLIFLLAIAITGILQGLPVFGVIAVIGFTPYSLSWVASIHITIIYAWIVTSLFVGGAVRHALATVVWRFTSTEKKHALFSTFSDACGRCGRCVEICSLYEATKGTSQSPIVKLKKYFKAIATRSLTGEEIRSIGEQTALCTMCGLCAGVCPFSFDFVGMYKELLAYIGRAVPVTSLASEH